MLASHAGWLGCLSSWFVASALLTQPIAAFQDVKAGGCQCGGQTEANPEQRGICVCLFHFCGWSPPAYVYFGMCCPPNSSPHTCMYYSMTMKTVGTCQCTSPENCPEENCPNCFRERAEAVLVADKASENAGGPSVAKPGSLIVGPGLAPGRKIRPDEPVIQLAEDPQAKWSSKLLGKPIFVEVKPPNGGKIFIKLQRILIFGRCDLDVPEDWKVVVTGVGSQLEGDPPPNQAVIKIPPDKIKRLPLEEGSDKSHAIIVVHDDWEFFVNLADPI